MALRLGDVQKKKPAKAATKSDAKVSAKSSVKAAGAKSVAKSKASNRVSIEARPEHKLDFIESASVTEAVKSAATAAAAVQVPAPAPGNEVNRSRPWSQAGLAKHGRSRNSHMKSETNMADRQPDNEEWLGFSEEPLFWYDVAGDSRLQMVQEAVADFEARVLSLTRAPYRKAMRAMKKVSVPQKLLNSIEKAHAVAMFIKKLRT